MKPIVRKGQEWFKEHSDGVASPPTRLLVLADPVGGRVSVGTVTKDGRVIRAREILVSALSNTPSGYRLVQDAPGPTSAATSLDWSKHGSACEYHEDLGGGGAWHCAPDCPSKATPTQPPPLARVREALRDYTLNGGTADARMSARDALAALAPLEHIFPDAMQSLHDVRHTRGSRDLSSPARWQDCPKCAALLEGK